MAVEYFYTIDVDGGLFITLENKITRRNEPGEYFWPGGYYFRTGFLGYGWMHGQIFMDATHIHPGPSISHQKHICGLWSPTTGGVRV